MHESSSVRGIVPDAAVLRGSMDFGRPSHQHTAKILRLSQDLPLVVEIVDSQEKIETFLPTLDGMMNSGLETLEKARVIRYGARIASHDAGAETP